MWDTILCVCHDEHWPHFVTGWCSSCECPHLHFARLHMNEAARLDDEDARIPADLAGARVELCVSMRAHANIASKRKKSIMCMPRQLKQPGPSAAGTNATSSTRVCACGCLSHVRFNMFLHALAYMRALTCACTCADLCLQPIHAKQTATRQLPYQVCTLKPFLLTSHQSPTSSGLQGCIGGCDLSDEVALQVSQ